MLQDNPLTTIAANIARIPFRLARRRPFTTPEKILILKPGNLEQVILTTPLLTTLDTAFPQARIDWALDDQFRSAVVGNPRLTAIITSDALSGPDASWEVVQELIASLREEQYDTCFVPGRSSVLSYIAWQAGIPQRVGFDEAGRGFAYTHPVKVPKDARSEIERNLALTRNIGIHSAAKPEFYPTDRQRSRVTELLAESIAWDGIQPLLVLAPGMGADAAGPCDPTYCWPAERFALLGSKLARQFGIAVAIIGGVTERELAEAVQGMISARTANFAGSLDLGEIGALCEVADLYIGNNSGVTQLAVAVGSPTLAILGPDEAGRYESQRVNGSLGLLRANRRGKSFSWADQIPVEEAVLAAARLLGKY